MRCFWYLVYIDCSQTTTRRSRYLQKGNLMSNTASIGLVPSTTLFGRFLAALDRVLMASAHASIRNGDLPYFGL
jgi:hypothetical protein